ncbi:MAG TPA: DUF167 family protein [Vicinamibacterales bacterium]|nr:DUF167 family protein [Vicinamibacterales bacterium]
MTHGVVAVRHGRTGARFDVRVVPRGARTAIEGLRDGSLLVRVTAPPVEGAANDAVVAVVAAALGVARRDLHVVAGATSRRKTLEVAGLDEVTLSGRLTALLS